MENLSGLGPVLFECLDLFTFLPGQGVSDLIQLTKVGLTMNVCLMDWPSQSIIIAAHLFSSKSTVSRMDLHVLGPTFIN